VEDKNARGLSVLAACAALFGGAVCAASPALSDPRVPNDVWIQCSSFSGPSTQWPHPLSGCTSRSKENGSGQSIRTTPGTETIQWFAPFESGKSFELVNIQNTVVGPSPDCPVDHSVKAQVSGNLAPGGQYGGSLVTATICANATDFLLQPGTLFVVHKS
jgi:hypothetical protein